MFSESIFTRMFFCKKNFFRKIWHSISRKIFVKAYAIDLFINYLFSSFHTWFIPGGLQRTCTLKFTKHINELLGDSRLGLSIESNNCRRSTVFFVYRFVSLVFLFAKFFDAVWLQCVRDCPRLCMLTSISRSPGMVYFPFRFQNSKVQKRIMTSFNFFLSV